MKPLELLRVGDSKGALVALGLVEEPDTEWLAVQGMALLADGKPVEARDVLRNAIRNGDSSGSTILNLALAEYGAGDVEQAFALVGRVVESVPDWDEPWLRLAEMSRERGDDEAAQNYYTKVLDRNPHRSEALIGKAVLCLKNRKSVEAQGLLLTCVGQCPELDEAWDALGIALMQTGDIGAAETAFSEAQARSPCNFQYALRRVEAAFLGGGAESELVRLEQKSAEDPLNAALPCARGVLLNRLGRYEEALDFLRVSTLLDPHAAEPMQLLLETVTHCPTHRDAVAILTKALESDPNNIEVANNLGAVLLRQHRPFEAANILRKADEERGGDSVNLANLANATILLGEQDEAVTIARHAVELVPTSVLARRALVNALPYVFGTDARDLLAELRGISGLLPRTPHDFPNVPDVGRRLRVGLLSTSLRTHPVGWLTLAGLENLDPNEFEIVCLGQRLSQDAMARRFRAISSVWHTIENLPDDQIVAAGRELEVDVLIDLGGYGEAGRITACARRIAPVQIKWVGMQNHSTGLAEIDWMIGDRWEIPTRYEDLYAEGILRMPDGYVCYSPPANAPDVGPLPALTKGFITFGCFNNLAKITGQCIETWAEVLRRVRGSRMILKAHQYSDIQTREAVARKFSDQGVGPDCIEFRSSSPHREFLRQYGDVDIVLDPFPYTGGVTTCEALWMGVPTITLSGQIFAARHSTSHLSNVGLSDWIATTRDEYVDLAQSKSRETSELSILRGNLRSMTRDSALCDGARFGRNLGVLLRTAWREWCRKEQAGNLPDANTN